MSWQRWIQGAVRALKREEASLEKELGKVRERIVDLETLAKKNGLAAGSSPRKSGSRRLSPQGRAAISRAAKKRWAEYRKKKGN